MRVCKDCNEEKELSEFPKCGGNRTRPYCKPCYNDRQKTYREGEAKEKVQESWRGASRKYHSYDGRRNKTLRAYGLTEQTYNDMFDLQGGKCAICGKDISVLCVDHCHKTLIIRGLLCHKCNLGLGYFDDDPDTLDAAAKYLRRYEPTTSNNKRSEK